MREVISPTWQDVPLGQLVKGFRGVSYRPENLLDHASDSTVTLLRATNIQQGNLTFDDVQFVPSWLVAPTQILTSGDIAVCMSNGSKALVGKSAQYRRSEQTVYTVGAFCSIFKPLESADSEFVFHLFRSQTYQKNIDVVLAGSAINNLKNSSIESAIFRVPADKQIRQKISTILSTIDTAIEHTEALIEKYQHIKAGLMHDLFTRGVLPNGQLRPPREQAPELYQETAIGWIPREWTLSNLRSCLLETPTNGIYKSAEMIGEGTLMVGQTAFTAERSIDFSLCRRGLVDASELRRYSLTKDDILVTRVFATVQGVGLPTLVPELAESAVFESNMMRLRIDPEAVLPRLLFEWLRGQQVRRFIHGGANASNQSSVNQRVLNPLPVPLPEMGEQTRMTVMIEMLDRRYAIEQVALAKLQSQKLGLMQDLLTGKVPVTVDAAHSEAVA